ncbi:tyrosine-protein phosphatase [Gordonia sp. GONU]|uniref:tyrosine-protein phosphatase n=1 Tax=Gordonia amicalis TaxID=89053 RepID=UPI00046450C5|nr:tyrosine-protein phosphatase [Gordonia amicalis]MCR8898838.1 tyrosine-protein phosphatase [Gordonia sp. GONU]MCZ4650529.1 tyrosine-protein phosphatase [Gordonia amicalis]
MNDPTVRTTRTVWKTLAAIAIAAGLVAGCSATQSPPKHDEQSSVAAPAPAPRLASVDNFRDVAGTGDGYPVDRGHMRRGVLYRSNALTPDDHDLASLSALGIRRVYDLRTTLEIEAKPDVLPTGAAYVRHNIVGDDQGSAAMGLSSLRSADEARGLLILANKNFVTDPDDRAEIAATIRDIAAGQGPQLFHCTSGKDRTGWISAVVQTLVGVNRADVMRDYLLTNEYSAASIDKAASAAAAKAGPGTGGAVRVVSGVFPEALGAGLDEVDRQYGSMEEYARSGLGLSPDTIDALKAKLTA